MKLVDIIESIEGPTEEELLNRRKSRFASEKSDGFNGHTVKQLDNEYNKFEVDGEEVDSFPAMLKMIRQ